MSSTKLLPRLLRLPTQSLYQTPALRRMINTETAPILYTARAKVTGARTGYVQGDDLNIGLTMAKALGHTLSAKDRGRTNPEELFAAGYGACLQAAMNAVAPTLGVKMPAETEDSVVHATVHLVGDMKRLDMGLRIDLKVGVRGLDGETVKKVLGKALEICPYNRATRGNVPTNVEVVDIESGL
ncbi:OsmC/Ohr family [Poronia punctata]|nr:OsmC/Ohr family [Poronia punctata]